MDFEEDEKKKKLKSLKKVLSGILGNFGRRSKHYYPLLFYLSSDFEKLYAKMFVLMRAKSLCNNILTAS